MILTILDYNYQTLNQLNIFSIKMNIVKSYRDDQ